MQRWQQLPAGPSHATKPVRRSALGARDQLVNHNLRLVAHTWQLRLLTGLGGRTTATGRQSAELGQVQRDVRPVAANPH